MSETITTKCHSCEVLSHELRELKKGFDQMHQDFATLFAKHRNGKPNEEPVNGQDRWLITVPEFAGRLRRSVDTVHRNIREDHYAPGVIVRVDVGMPSERFMVDWKLYEEQHTKPALPVRP